MQRNKKAVNLSKAEIALNDILIAIEVDYNLTRLEVLHILNASAQRYLKYGVKEEWEEDEHSRPDSGRQADGD